MTENEQRKEMQEISENSHYHYNPAPMIKPRFQKMRLSECVTKLTYCQNRETNFPFNVYSWVSSM